MSNTILGNYVKQQLERWEGLSQGHGRYQGKQIPVLTLCMLPGSNGAAIAEKVAQTLGFDYFNRELIEVIAKEADVSPESLEKIERERFSGIQDFISLLMDEKYLWRGVYLEHLENIVNAIGERGYALIVGRGGNFILERQQRLAVRVVAPLEFRIDNIAQRRNLSREEAKKQILHRESRRAAFVKQSFKADINDPIHYDLVVNSESVGIDNAVGMICDAWFDKFA